MAANIADKISKVTSGVRPVSTTVSTIRNSGATTLACADLTGWTTGEVVFFVTYKIDGSSNVIPGSQSDWKGIVSGSNINNLNLTAGSDAGNAAGDVVEMLPTPEYAKNLAENILAHANQNGTLISSAVTASLAGTTLPSNTVTTTSITDASVTYAKLLSTIFGSQVTSYTNTGSGGGTGYYINLGGIKLCWGTSGAYTSTTNTNYTVSLPSSFFTTIQHHNVYIVGSSATVNYVGQSASTSTLTIFVGTAANNNNNSWFVIGT